MIKGCWGIIGRETANEYEYPICRYAHRVSLFGFSFLSESGSKVKTPLLKKAGIKMFYSRCKARDNHLVLPERRQGFPIVVPD